MKLFAASSKNTLVNPLREFVSYSELKQMAYNLTALQQQKKFHSLAVLSFFPGEGKTLFCAAMALAYAQASRAKVLIVDTSIYQNKGSLALGQCLDGSEPLVEVRSLQELRSEGPVRKSETLAERQPAASTPPENDFDLLKKWALEGSKQYGLVLLDTAPLNAKNKSNVDPLLAARLAESAVLVVSRKFLHVRHVSSYMTILEDPSLHLLGIVSNEAFSR